jgi:hypothetical protein
MRQVRQSSHICRAGQPQVSSRRRQPKLENAPKFWRWLVHAEAGSQCNIGVVRGAEVTRQSGPHTLARARDWGCPKTPDCTLHTSAESGKSSVQPYIEIRSNANWLVQIPEQASHGFCRRADRGVDASSTVNGDQGRIGRGRQRRACADSGHSCGSWLTSCRQSREQLSNLSGERTTMCTRRITPVTCHRLSR